MIKFYSLHIEKLGLEMWYLAVNAGQEGEVKMRKEKAPRKIGITYLELAMVLIAFVLVGAVLVFGALVTEGKFDFLPLLGEEKGPTTLEAIDRSLGGGWLIRLQNGHSYQVGSTHCDVVGGFLRCNFPITITEE